MLASSPLDGLQRIALRNQYAQQAQAAYKQKEYQQAAALYEKVRGTERGGSHSSVVLNLAHSYFHLHEYTKASPLYRSLLKTTDNELLSTVTSQLAIIEAEEGNYPKALTYCKQALKADETNQAARYNYELLQKYILLHPEQRQTPPPPPKRTPQNGTGSAQQPNAAGSSSAGGSAGVAATGAGTSANGGGESGTQLGQGNANQLQNFGNTPGLNRGLSDRGTQDSNGNGGNQRNRETGQADDALLQTRFERLKKLQLSPEKARQLLDAMRQEEAQYLQQVPRSKTKQADKNAPDW